MLLLMCVPAIAFFIIFNYAPLPGIWIAFTNFNYRDGIFGSPFVGLKNFEFLIKSGQLWLLTRNTILYNLAFIVLGQHPADRDRDHAQRDPARCSSRRSARA